MDTGFDEVASDQPRASLQPTIVAPARVAEAGLKAIFAGRSSVIGPAEPARGLLQPVHLAVFAGEGHLSSVEVKRVIAPHAHALEDKAARRSAILQAAGALFLPARAVCLRQPKLLPQPDFAKGTVYAVLERNLPLYALTSYKADYLVRLEETGRVIDLALRFEKGRGVQLLMRTYALTRGLWQSYQHAVETLLAGVTVAQSLMSNPFGEELREALTEYWRGALPGLIQPGLRTPRRTRTKS